MPIELSLPFGRNLWFDDGRLTDVGVIRKHYPGTRIMAVDIRPVAPVVRLAVHAGVSTDTFCPRGARILVGGTGIIDSKNPSSQSLIYPSF